MSESPYVRLIVDNLRNGKTETIFDKFKPPIDEELKELGLIDKIKEEILESSYSKNRKRTYVDSYKYTLEV